MIFITNPALNYYFIIVGENLVTSRVKSSIADNPGVKSPIADNPIAIFLADNLKLKVCEHYASRKIRLQHFLTV